MLSAGRAVAYHTPGASIRNRLTALKQNRGEYIKSQDVLSIYQAVVKQGTPFLASLSAVYIEFNLLPLPWRLVDKLNDLRDQERGAHVSNRLDTLLADVFSLLSLFFLTIGKGRECPATYSQIASMRVSLKFCYILRCGQLGIRAGRALTHLSPHYVTLPELRGAL